MVRPMSQKTSMAKISPNPSGGIPNIPQVASTTTNEALGTPAMPLLVSMNTSSIDTWVAILPVTEVILYACAMNMLANVIYIMLPSRLNEYPSGNTNDTILLLHP